MLPTVDNKVTAVLSYTYTILDQLVAGAGPALFNVFAYYSVFAKSCPCLLRVWLCTVHAESAKERPIIDENALA